MILQSSPPEPPDLGISAPDSAKWRVSRARTPFSDMSQRLMKEFREASQSTVWMVHVQDEDLPARTSPEDAFTLKTLYSM